MQYVNCERIAPWEQKSGLWWCVVSIYCCHGHCRHIYLNTVVGVTQRSLAAFSFRNKVKLSSSLHLSKKRIHQGVAFSWHSTPHGFFKTNSAELEPLLSEVHNCSLIGEQPPLVVALLITIPTYPCRNYTHSPPLSWAPPSSVPLRSTL